MRGFFAYFNLILGRKHGIIYQTVKLYQNIYQMSFWIMKLVNKRKEDSHGQEKNHSRLRPGHGRFDGHCDGLQIGGAGCSGGDHGEWQLSRRSDLRECTEGAGNDWPHGCSCGQRHGRSDGSRYPERPVLSWCRRSGRELPAGAEDSPQPEARYRPHH